MRGSRWTPAGVWGVSGTVAVLVDAIARLLPKAAAPFAEGADPELVVTYAASMAVFGYVEGYRGFQLRFAPQVVARARALRGPVQTALAPLYCFGLLGGTRASRVRSWSLIAMIVGFIVLVSFLGERLRGAVDAGVVVGLSWGTISILWCAGSPARVPAREQA